MLSHKGFLACGAAAAVVCMATQATAQTRSFNVPAQSAVSAIPQFAQQAQLQIVAPAGDLQGVRTRAVVGELDVRVALRRLIEGAPLEIASDDGRVVVLRAAPRPPSGRSAGDRGVVSGRVLDPATGEYMRNAIIEVETASGRLQTTAGDRGEYRLGGVPAGPARATVKFTGYPDQTVPVEVRPGEETELNFDLARPGFEVDSVVVVGVLEGDARAIMSQRQSMDIKNSLSAESYGDISEGNPGEFIKFMPGVDTDSTGDGTVRTVSLRGLPPAYTNITLNGVSLAGADANTGAESSRTFSFEQMSLSAIDSIEISKTVSADVDANAPAGTINVRTKRAFDRRGRRILAQVSASTHSNMWDDPQGTGPGEGGYGNTRWLPNGQLEYSDVFFGRRLGVVASASRSTLYVEQEQITASRNYAPTAASPQPLAITSIEAQMGAREITRESASLNLDFRATDHLILSLATMFNKSGIWAETISPIFTTGARTRGVIGDPVFDITTQQLATANTFSIQNSLTYKDGEGKTIVPSFEYDNGLFRLDGYLSHSDSVSTYDPQGKKNSANVLSALTARGNFSAQRDPGDLYGQAWQIRQLSGGDWADPASFTGPNPLVLRINSGPYAEHVARSGALNLTFDRDIFSVPVTFKTGLKRQQAQYIYEDRSDLSRYNYVGPISLTELLRRVQSPNQHSAADSGVNITTLSGSQNFYMPSTYKLLELYREHPEWWAQTTTTSPTEWYNIYVGNSRDYTETTTAAYAMGTADFGERLKVRAGLRWERTETVAMEADPLSAEEVRAAGFAVSATTGRATTIPGLQHQYQTRPKVERKGDYDYFFPSASVKYAFDDSTDLQIGYSRTIRRPEVNVLSGVWSVNDIDRIITAPNPGLEPEISDNISVRLVKYFEPVGMVAVNYYQNRVKGLFQTEELTAEEFGYTGSDYADYLFRTTTTVSGEAIKIHGYEVEFSHAMDYLPGALGGLSVRGSFMVNDPEVPIVRVADKLGTLSISYRSGPVKLFFNSVWTDEKYRTTTPSWFDKYWDTNLSGSYELRKGWEAFFNIRNLLNSSRNVIVPGTLATSGQVGDHSAIFIHGGSNATFGLRARF